MKFYGKAEQTAIAILERFKNPEALPAAMAPAFIEFGGERPSAKWSMRNRLIVAMLGDADARGFKQWESVGRKVRKGEKARYILSPCVAKKDKDNPDAGTILIGFKGTAVFGKDQTEGEELPGENETRQFLSTLPLRHVAEMWGIKMDAYNGKGDHAKGFYSYGQDEGISLGVKNLATWAHELIHAADHRSVGDEKFRDQSPVAKREKEIIAELGGAILLELIGESIEADLGGCYEYLTHWCEGKPETAALKLLSRVCNAVSLVMETSRTFETAKSTRKGRDFGMYQGVAA